MAAMPSDLLKYLIKCHCTTLIIILYLRVRSINLVVGVWQNGQITWISDLWLVVGNTIILIDLAAPLIYVTSISYIDLMIGLYGR